MKLTCCYKSDKSMILFIVDIDSGKYDTIQNDDVANNNVFSKSIGNFIPLDTEIYDIIDTNMFGFKNRDAFNSLAIEYTQAEMPRSIVTFRDFLQCYPITMVQKIWLLIIVMMSKYTMTKFNQKIEFLDLLIIYAKFKNLILNKKMDEREVSKFLNKLMSQHIDTEIEKI